MKLEFLLSPLKLDLLYPDIEVSSISMHSDFVEKNSIFVSIARDKSQKDANNNLAIENGAKVILQEDNVINMSWYNDILIISFPACIEYLPQLLMRMYPNSSSLQYYIGVTGTNGKTTIVNWISYIAKQQGIELGVIGTLGAKYAGVEIKSGLTSPDIATTYALLNDMSLRKVNGCAIEMSSHGLMQGRAKGIPISIGIFSSFSQDHLDYHGSMDNYFQAKTKLFEEYNLQYVIFNLDDPRIKNYFDSSYSNEAFIIGYSLYGEAECRKCDLIVRASKQKVSGITTEFDLIFKEESIKCQIPTIGHYNLSNALAVFCASYCLGLDIVKTSESLSGLPIVPGRFEIVKHSQNIKFPKVIVDFAHTPDGLDNILSSIKPVCSGDLIVLFGCGGDRDKNKRAPMLEAVAKYADRIFITQDNSRTETFGSILADILSKCGKEDERIEVISDRKEAIKAAIRIAKIKDVVVIAGRGHESVQDLGKEKLQYKDIDVVHEMIKNIEERILDREDW